MVILGISRFGVPQPLLPKGNSKLEILLKEIFSAEQERNEILSATLEKLNFFLFKKTVSRSFRKPNPLMQL